MKTSAYTKTQWTENRKGELGGNRNKLLEMIFFHCLAFFIYIQWVNNTVTCTN